VAEDLIALSRRIAKAKPLADAEWYMEMEDRKTGLPTALGPFSIWEERDEDGPNGKWSVKVVTKAGRHDAVLFDGLDGVFAAYRRLIDCFEAWQLIKPVERVYFIGTKLARGHDVKVGYSRDPKARLRALQTSHGERLQIFATVEGGKDLEAKYHTRWRSRRRSGEWFTIGDCIINEIERLNGTRI
jgi:T5orf172 domain